MDPHQWLLILIFAIAFIYALAEATTQLINKHKIQITLDSMRARSWLNRQLLPAAAGALRARLNLGKLLFLLMFTIAASLRFPAQPLTLVLVLSVASLLLYYAPIALAVIQPKLLFRLSLPVIKIFSPFIHVLSLPRDLFFYGYRNKMRVQGNNGHEHDQEEARQLQAYLGEAEEEGIFEPDEAQMVRQVVEFSDTVVKEIMTPRVNIEYVEKGMKLEEFIPFAADLKYSRYPVIDGKIDNVIGVIHIKTLLGVSPSEYAEKPVEDFALTPYFVPESKKVSLLLRDFQAAKQQLAVVVDEYGGTSGIITLEDILEEIVGEIEDEHDSAEEENEINWQDDGSLEVSGNVDVSEIEKILDVEMDDEAYETVSGLALSHLKHIPEVGETFVTESGIEVQILAADEKSINTVRLRKIEENE